jgi:uncharacterized membrane protein YbhN (UPF0104 family)
LLSIAGFVLVFRLVFARRLAWRRSLSAGLCGLAASTVLPAGGLIGPAAGARSALPEDASDGVTARSAVTFLILTNAPSVVVLGGLGLLEWAGGAAGPRQPVLTLLPAAIAIALILLTWHVSDPTTGGDARSGVALLPLPTLARGHRVLRPIRGGAAEARRLLASLHWQLAGALAYYAFDNAALWATFHAFGRTPPVSVIVMGYLVGSLAGSLPLPAGVGAVEGGMVGALILYGAPAAPAASAVLLYRALSLSLPLTLGAFAWRSGAVAPPPAEASGTTDEAL